MTRGGEIQIIQDGAHGFAVMIWDRHRDAGFIARTFPTRQRAIDFAEGMAEASGLTLHRADVVALRAGAA